MSYSTGLKTFGDYLRSLRSERGWAVAPKTCSTFGFLKLTPYDNLATIFALSGVKFECKRIKLQEALDGQ